MSTGSASLGRIKVEASSTPMFVPTGLNAWAKLRRRVAVDSGPSERTYGFADVSRIEQPAAIANRAMRKASYVMILLAG
jgi:hypothetical protein